MVTTTAYSKKISTGLIPCIKFNLNWKKQVGTYHANENMQYIFKGIFSRSFVIWFFARSGASDADKKSKSGSHRGLHSDRKRGREARNGIQAWSRAVTHAFTRGILQFGKKVLHEKDGKPRNSEQLNFLKRILDIQWFNTNNKWIIGYIYIYIFLFIAFVFNTP